VVQSSIGAGAARDGQKASNFSKLALFSSVLTPYHKANVKYLACHAFSGLMEHLVDARFGAYLVVAALLIVTPGPDTALTIRNALRFGWRASSMSTFGIALGSLVWAVAAVLGVAVLLHKSVIAFTIFKLAGAAFLAYLGVRSILGSLRSGNESSSAEGRLAVGRIRDRIALRQGLLNNLLNPKAGAIFVTALPQFINQGDSPLRLILMMAAYEAILIIWLNIYGGLVSQAGRTHLGGRVRHALERLMGAVLIGLGVRLALESP
jgi:threonine/homoserine/homoserine lactone efflux protein